MDQPKSISSKPGRLHSLSTRKRSNSEDHVEKEAGEIQPIHAAEIPITCNEVPTDIEGLFERLAGTHMARSILSERNSPPAKNPPLAKKRQAKRIPKRLCKP